MNERDDWLDAAIEMFVGGGYTTADVANEFDVRISVLGRLLSREIPAQERARIARVNNALGLEIELTEAQCRDLYDCYKDVGNIDRLTREISGVSREKLKEEWKEMGLKYPLFSHGHRRRKVSKGVKCRECEILASEMLFYSWHSGGLPICVRCLLRKAGCRNLLRIKHVGRYFWTKHGRRFLEGNGNERETCAVCGRLLAGTFTDGATCLRCFLESDDLPQEEIRALVEVAGKVGVEW